MIVDVTKRRDSDDTGWIPPRIAARALGVDSRTVTRMGDRGEIRSMRLPSGHRRFLAEDVEAILRNREGAIAS